MTLGSRDRERFWIALMVRFGFGFLFLIAAINILTLEWQENLPILENVSPQRIQASLVSFADIQAKYYEGSWVNIKIDHGPVNPLTGAKEKQLALGMIGIRWFLYSMPFVFLVLAILLLTGLFLRPTLRLTAFYLLMLGIGKYLVDFKTGNTLTTMQDFMWAMFICVALFVLSKEEGPAEAA